MMASVYNFRSPPNLSEHDDNEQVRRFLYYWLRKFDANLDDENAQSLSEKYFGDGEIALAYDKQQWQALLGDIQGSLIHRKIQILQPKYVDKDSVWPYLRWLYNIILLALAIHTGPTFKDGQIKFERSWIPILAIIYFTLYRFFHIFCSSTWLQNSYHWPAFIKTGYDEPSMEEWFQFFKRGV